MKVDRLWKNKWLAALIFALLGLLVLFMLIQIRPLLIGTYDFLKAVLAPFFVAMIVSYVLNPVVNLLNERKVPRTIAILLIYAVFFTTLTVILMNLVPVFMMQLNELNEHMPDMMMRAQSIVEGFNQSRLMPESVRSGIFGSMRHFEENITQMISNFISRIGSTINLVFTAFIIPFLAFYILKDFQMIEKTALTIVPKNRRKEVASLLIDIDNALGSYIRGQFLVGLIVGVLAYIGYWIIGMPYPLLLAGIVAVFDIVPYLGPFLGAAPAVIMASTVSWKMVLLVIFVNTFVQIMESNIVSPQVVGRTLHMHPLIIIFALLVGGEVGGVVGLILAVPFFAAMKVIIQHMFKYYIYRKTNRI